MTSKLISIRLPEWLAKELDIEAAEEGLNRTEFIKRLYLEHKENQLNIEKWLEYESQSTIERS